MADLLTIQREQTRHFIAYDPQSIVLIPTVYSMTAQGGQSESAGSPRDAQDMRLIALNPQQRITITTSGGRERIIDFHLLGTYDAEMEVGDHWLDADGNRYEVVHIDAGHGYEKKGYVELHRSSDRPVVTS